MSLCDWGARSYKKAFWNKLRSQSNSDRLSTALESRSGAKNKNDHRYTFFKDYALKRSERQNAPEELRRVNWQFACQKGTIMTTNSAAGNLYGTAQYGGAFGFGAVFKLTP